MFAAYLIMLREGVEAALIVGIIAGYLKQSGRAEWLPKVWVGVGAAVAVCLAVGFALVSAKEFPQREQELFEGLVALAGDGDPDLDGLLDEEGGALDQGAAARFGRQRACAPGDRQGLALIGMVFFAVGREGLEFLFFLLAIVQQSEGWAVPIGAALGLASAVAVGFAIYYGGVKLEPAPLLPLDRRLHHVRRRGPARRRGARVPRSRALERPAETAFDFSACCRRTA